MDEVKSTGVGSLTTKRPFNMCGDCKFFVQGSKNADGKTMGVCVRRAPVLVEGAKDIWPTVECDEFCGEYVWELAR